MLKKYAVRVFDGTYTRIYTTQAIDENAAADKIVDYYTAFGCTIEVKAVTEIGK